MTAPCCCAPAQNPSIYGTFLREFALAVPAGVVVQGATISHDRAHLVLSCTDKSLLVFAMPTGTFLRKIEAGLQDPAKIAFTGDNNILVAEHSGKRVQEVSLTGESVRIIGEGVINDNVSGVATNDEFIVVAKSHTESDNRVLVFDACTGDLVRSFGAYGGAPGQINRFVSAVRISPDGTHVFVAEGDGAGVSRVSQFTITGEFVKVIGAGDLKAPADFAFAASGDIVVVDAPAEGAQRVVVYATDAEAKVVRQFGESGEEQGKFKLPSAIAMCGGLAYIVDNGNNRVQVFE